MATASNKAITARAERLRPERFCLGESGAGTLESVQAGDVPVRAGCRVGLTNRVCIRGNG